MIKNTHIYTRSGEQKYPSIRTLYPHQLKILSELENGKVYVMAGCRMGKTRPVIAFLAETPKVLVLTKKAAIGGWLSELEAMGVEGWTVVNYERVRTKGWDMSAEWGALVCDENHVLGRFAKPAETTKAVYKLKVSGPRVGISATPCAESYSQLFHQAKALKMPLWSEYKNFYHWHKAYGIPDTIRANGRMLETYKETKPSVWEEFKPFCSIVDRQKAVSGFVEATDNLVTIDAPEVLELCAQLKRDGILKIDGRVVVAETPLAVAQKCQQICAGWVLDDEGEAVFIHRHKLDFAAKLAEGQKTAVLTTFKAEVGGYTSEGFQVDSDGFMGGRIDKFVGNVQSYARGIDFSIADALVLTGCPWSSETFLQSRDRLLRNDRDRVAMVYYPVIKGGIDEQIYNVVAGEKRQFTARLYR